MERQLNRKETILEIKREMGEMRPRKALKKCINALCLYPEDPELLLLKGESLLGIPGKDNEAKTVFKTLVQKAPRLAPAHAGLAFLNYHNGQYQEALQGFKKALELDKKEVRAIVFLAATLNDMGKTKEALELLNKNIKQRMRSPKDAPDRAFLMSAKAKIIRKTVGVGQAKPLALDAVKVSSMHPVSLYEVRRCNPKTTRNSKAYLVQVEGVTTKMSLFTKDPAQYCAWYEVIADSKQEALGFIREIEPIAEPESLDLKNCKKLRRVPKNQHKGVTMILPSFSATVLPADMSEDVQRGLQYMQ